MQKISILTACIALSLIRVACADVRLAKFFPDEVFDLSPTDGTA